MVLHVELDAFFVSVEELHDPSLKGKAVVVGGRLEMRDGRLQRPAASFPAASYAARKFGVHSRCLLSKRTASARWRSSSLEHYNRYVEIPGASRRFFHRFSPAVSMASIDEAYI